MRTEGDDQLNPAPRPTPGTGPRSGPGPGPVSGPESTLRLGPEDAGALDALAEAGFTQPAATPREEHIVKLLRTLDHESTAEASARTSQREVRVGVTMARVARLAQQAGAARGEAEPHDDELSTRDQDALDAFVLAGYRANKVPGVLADRARVVEGVGALLEVGLSGAANGRADRIEATLAAVQQSRMRMHPLETVRASRGGMRWSDLISVAAILLIGASIVWPVSASVRASSQQAACGGNLASIAEALGLYAGNNREAMPVAPNGWGGWESPRDARWWSVGQPGSNSANLFRLASLGYTKLGAMACAGNPDAIRDFADADPAHQHNDWTDLQQVSYSFQIRVPEPGAEFAWRGERGPAILLADRSPVVLRAVRKQVIFPMQNSPNHGGRGQNVLKSDGSVAWLETPVDVSDDPNGNNIWLPSQIEDLIHQAQMQMNSGQRMEPIKGREVPGSPRDPFLGP